MRESQDCDRPMYHVRCIQDIAKVPVARGRHWRCNDCFTRKTARGATMTESPAANAAPAAAAAAAAAAVPTTAIAAQAPVPATLPALTASDVARAGPVTKEADAVSEDHQPYGDAMFVLAEPGSQGPGPGGVP